MDNVKSNFCNGHCSCCGECCAVTLPMTKKEVQAIKTYVRIHPEILQAIANNEPVVDNNVYCTCTCYDRVAHKCLVYDVRPAICRTFACNKSMAEITRGRQIAESKAFYNRANDNAGKYGYENITDLRELLLGDPTLILYSVLGVIPDKNHLPEALIMLGRADLVKYIVKGKGI